MKAAESTEKPKPYYVIFDSNIWVGEHLLKSSIGDAILYAFSSSDELIGLPEVIEMEVNRVLERRAEEAFENFKKSARLLEKVSGIKTAHTAPSETAIKNGITARWKQLAGLLKRVPFTEKHARSSLMRIIDHAPPSGKNNEQFRDCCIWEVALELASERAVYLVTNDSAFYKDRNIVAGLAENLSQEIKEKKLDIKIFSDVKGLLSALGSSVSLPDENNIKHGIVDGTKARAKAILLEEGDRFSLGEEQKVILKGFATPTASNIAIAFEITFSIIAEEASDDRYYIRLSGTCSYEPSKKAIADVGVSGWTMSMGGDGFRSRISKEAMEAYREEGSLRLIR